MSYEKQALKQYLIELKAIKKMVGAEKKKTKLEEGQTDEGDLGYTYSEMEPAIRFCLKHYDKMDEIATVYRYKKSYGNINFKIVDFVWKRHVANRHKHIAPPVIKMRDKLK